VEPLRLLRKINKKSLKFYSTIPLDLERLSPISFCETSPHFLSMQFDTSHLSLWDTTTATSCLTPYTRSEIITAWPLPTLPYRDHLTRSSLINTAIALSGANQACLLHNLRTGCHCLSGSQWLFLSFQPCASWGFLKVSPIKCPMQSSSLSTGKNRT